LEDFVNAVPLQTPDVEDAGKIGRVASKADTNEVEAHARVLAECSEADLGSRRYRSVVLNHLCARGRFVSRARWRNDAESIGEVKAVVRERDGLRREAVRLRFVYNLNSRDIVKLCMVRYKFPKRKIRGTYLEDDFSLITRGTAGCRWQS